MEDGDFEEWWCTQSYGIVTPGNDGMFVLGGIVMSENGDYAITGYSDLVEW